MSLASVEASRTSTTPSIWSSEEHVGGEFGFIDAAMGSMPGADHVAKGGVSLNGYPPRSEAVW